MDIGIIGGTGKAGRALAARLAWAGKQVAIGSREVSKAAEACFDLDDQWGDKHLQLFPLSNDEAALCPVVVIATPASSAREAVRLLEKQLVGKVVVSMVNPVVKRGSEFVAVPVPPAGSMAAALAADLPNSNLIAAFNSLPARRLGDLSQTYEADVLLCSDSQRALITLTSMLADVAGLRPIAAGPLANAGAVEAFTAILLNINRRYGGDATLRFTDVVAPVAN